MNINPLVSIIIPTYNRAHFIADTLNSILTQTYTNWECIIVDDGSTDDSEFIISKYATSDSRFKFYNRPIDRIKGANTCRNYGFELCKGEYINWFDSDDIMFEDFLDAKIKEFTSEINLVVTTCFMVDEMLNNRKILFLDERADLFNEYSTLKLKIITGSVIFKKSFLADRELFLHKISRGQELELFSRLFFKLSKEKYKICNTPLFLYRQHYNSKTYKDTGYIKKYKESLAYIHAENFKKSIELQDLELINKHYQLLVDYFFRGLENNHRYNSALILKKTISLLVFRKMTLAAEMMFLGGLLLILSRGSYRIEKRWRLIKI